MNKGEKELKSTLSSSTQNRLYTPYGNSIKELGIILIYRLLTMASIYISWRKTMKEFDTQLSSSQDDTYNTWVAWVKWKKKSYKPTFERFHYFSSTYSPQLQQSLTLVQHWKLTLGIFVMFSFDLTCDLPCLLFERAFVRQNTSFGWLPCFQWGFSGYSSQSPHAFPQIANRCFDETYSTQNQRDFEFSFVTSL